MLGVLLGAASIIGISRFARHRAWRHGYGGYGGCGRGRGGYDYRYREHEHDREDRHDWRDRDFGAPPKFFLRRLFEHLDTTPGQEKVISEAFDRIFASLQASRGGISKTRQNLADALREEQVDVQKLRELLAEPQDRMSELTASASESIAKVHAVLDPKQREKLADFIAGGFRRGFQSPWYDV